jgi:hypothetical protein
MNQKEVDEIVKNTDDQIPFDKDYFVVIRPSKIHGSGLFTQVDIPAGKTICPGRVGNFRTPAGRYINHSATPNTYMKIFANSIDVVAAENILKGSELTSNYAHTHSIASPNG